ncbi:O-acetyl-ADP-ribose deacetylase (regulator of RNase III) [Motilibacter peucedani]|uniref:O-acetyl-ADP-ribose deacetylase (Regulator of RNase III) n=1 Tax=Motilibacter peucedani TaxID=598650 RepID=A0A420XT31_9ACTN|nr:O-acetyl-ADP-ribose deacetylase (regulator of RNase III) [Motilibacter peucedani]
MSPVRLIRGDITEQRVDVIVNAANSGLLGGGGVDGAIHRRGGPDILRECQHLRATTLPDGLPAGQAVATTAGQLQARWVVHTVGPVWSSSIDRSPVLRSAYTSSLRVSAELGAQTVAFPAISAGVYGWPLAAAAEVAVRAVLGSPVVMREVRFVLFGHDAYEAFRVALDAATRRD